MDMHFPWSSYKLAEFGTVPETVRGHVKIPGNYPIYIWYLICSVGTGVTHSSQVFGTIMCNALEGQLHEKAAVFMSNILLGW